MGRTTTKQALSLGFLLFLGLAALGYLLGDAAIRFKQHERIVSVKGLAEQEFPADVVIWPIHYSEAGDDLRALYAAMEANQTAVRAFLQSKGIQDDELSFSMISTTDSSTRHRYGDTEPDFRYIATQSVTVYSQRVDAIREVMRDVGELGRQGIVLGGGWIQYLFTRLNEVKPAMVEEATRNARVVAEKFAEDSASVLGKIRNASQGQFTIYDRDANTPHIKTVRVVSTLQYYLSD